MKKKMIMGIVAAFLLVGCQSPKKEVAETPKTEEKEKTVEKEKEESPKTTYKKPIATIEFEGLGTMKFELEVNDAPQSVYNFTELANSGYYDGLIMHRIVKDFVAQGGDPDGTGMGGPGYSIKGEFSSNGVSNPTQHNLGAIAFARSQQPDSAGSQFYIVLSEYDSTNMKRMNKDYAAFGQIIEGNELLETINNEYADESDPNGTPVKDLVIKSITVDTLGQELPSPEKLK